MPTIRRFEDLNVWQSARELVKFVYNFTIQGAFQKDFALRDQIRRAVISVMSNIAEGFGAGSDAQFTQFLGIQDVHLMRHNLNFTLLWIWNTSQRKTLIPFIKKQLWLKSNLMLS